MNVAVDTSISTRCCIAGGGPAGIMLGFLLARAGIPVVVLEKWRDFFRDFRGDTIHPSTMEVLRELDLLDDFLALPHNETRQIAGYFGTESAIVGDFTHLPVACPFIALIPQWDFLNFIVEKAKAYPNFHLRMETAATDLIVEDGVVKGVRATAPTGEVDIRADLVIGADGRHSTVRDKAGLLLTDLGAPIDVLWFRLSREKAPNEQSFGYVNGDKFLVLINRDSYWQCAYLIAKGAFENIKTRGLDAFRADVARTAPVLAHVTSEIKDWEDVKLLSVAVNHLRQWYRPGLLCIGDAAHAMSPVGGVGINLAIQDAVAAANILIPVFRKGAPQVDDLARVQARRASPALRTQKLQVFIHTRLMRPVLSGRYQVRGLPWFVRLSKWLPFMRRIPARVIGMGFRPEHVEKT